MFSMASSRGGGTSHLRRAAEPIFVLVFFAATLAGCGNGLLGTGLFDGGGVDTGSRGGYRVGRPYQINGRWYTPQEDFGYVETGTASWYGADFHGRPTASGETYDMNALTAAHRTLPLPSIVRVTNLDNGRSVVVRVNDRGPFSHGRIIDLSRRGAEELQFIGAGTARVRVEILEAESRRLANAGSATATRAVAAARTPQNAPRSRVATAPLPPPSPSHPTVASVAAPPSAVFIQTGAYRDYANARAARDQVAGLGVGPTHIYEATVDGRQYYRVRIGPLGDERSAEAILAGAAGRRMPGALVVME